MIGPYVALVILILYLLLLFGLARYAINRRIAGRSITSNPYVYALSLCVYVSAWIFYGSIGRAASTGLEFLAISFGPCVAMLLGPVIIKKMIMLSKEFRLASISDFISFRYGRSYTIGAIVALFSLIMVTPYIALQLIAISISLDILSGTHLIPGVQVESKLIVAVLLGIFAATFGARHINPMERHEGLIAVVAFEALIALIAFLLVGIYVTYGIFGGYDVILSRMSQLIATDPAYENLVDVDYPLWFSLIIISIFASMFLPRQFHVMVVENSDEAHIRKAMWIFPLYLLLISIFVPAIAWGGLILMTPGLADAFILTIPYSFGQDLVALLVFIGGVSAATAMVLVESVAVGTMMLNDLEVPYFLRRIGSGQNLPHLLLNMRRLNILMVVFLGYLFSIVAAYRTLADIGIISFLAVSQFAPAALGGLYWKKGNREGAIAGLISGFLIWIYTALIPMVAEEDFLANLVANGPFGIAFLRPTALFGLDVDVYTNSFFWSIGVNCALYILISLMYLPNQEETRLTKYFVDLSLIKDKPSQIGRISINSGTVDELEATLARYVGIEKSKHLIDLELAGIETTREEIDAKQLLEIWGKMEEKLLDNWMQAQPIMEAKKIR